LSTITVKKTNPMAGFQLLLRVRKLETLVTLNKPDIMRPAPKISPITKEIKYSRENILLPFLIQRTMKAIKNTMKAREETKKIIT